MAQTGAFTLPANTNFGATVFSNAAYTQVVTILVDGVQRAAFSGSGTNDKVLGSKVINSGSGKVQITVTANGKPSAILTANVSLADKCNFAVLGSEDGADADYNDAIVVMNWPLG